MTGGAITNFDYTLAPWLGAESVIVTCNTEFGLDKPSLTIAVKTRGGTPSKTLFLGNDHPTHTTVYARISDSPRVFMVGSLVRWDIDKEFDNLKNKRGPFFKTGQ